ncbi:MAG: hypothetical protein AB7T22_15685 [Calditrichaceae bacterium]
MKDIINIVLVVIMGASLFGLMVYVFYIGLSSDNKKMDKNILPPANDIKKLKKA